MDVLRKLGRNFFGLGKEKSDINSEESSFQQSRKRCLEEEVLTKESLNQPAKRRRIMNSDVEKDSMAETASPGLFAVVRTKLYSWFANTPETVECPKPTKTTLPDTIQAAAPTLYSSSKLDTDEVELLKVVNPKVGPLSETINHESSISKQLAAFSGFSKPLSNTLSRNPETPMTAFNRSHVGHSIRTNYERERQSELTSPHSIRKQMKSGFRSTFDKFFHEKDIAKTAFPSKVLKRRTQQNAFDYSKSLAERERYRSLLIKHSGSEEMNMKPMVRRNILFGKLPNVTEKRIEPSLGTLDLSTGVHDVDPKMVTSTAVKGKATSHKYEDSSDNPIPTSKEEIEASPMLSKEKNVSKLSADSATKRVEVFGVDSPLPSKIRDRTSDIHVPLNSLELELNQEEVYSPKYLAKLMDKYGAAAREREKLIEREEAKVSKCEQETENLCESIDKRLEQYLKITQVAIPEAVVEVEEYLDDESQPTELPELTNEMKSVIRKAERSGGQVLVDAHKIQITGRDIGTLQGLNWLNDEVINFYMQMIVTRSGEGKFCSVYAFTTFFYPKLKENGHSSVKRWTKKVDIFGYALVLVPVHLGMHWCLATIDNQRKVITYYDSMGGNNTGCVYALEEYISEEHLAKKGSPLDTSKWEKVIAKKIPQQMNGSDCGMFTCKFAEYISRRAKITFSQKDMPYFRRRMIYEIVSNKLIYP